MISAQLSRVRLGGERGEGLAGQFIMTPPDRATEGVVGGSDHKVLVVWTTLFQDHDEVVRLLQRVVEHALERCRLEHTIPHSRGPMWLPLDNTEIVLIQR